MRSKISALTFVAGLLCAAPAAAQLSGSVTYTGTESGSIVVEAFTEEQETFEKLTTTMVNPGPFEFTMVPEGAYTVVAYIDVNDDARLDGDEVWIGTGDPIQVPPGDSNITLDLDAYVAGGGDGGGDEDEGCCAVIGTDERSAPAAVLGLLLALVWRRRTF